MLTEKTVLTVFTAFIRKQKIYKSSKMIFLNIVLRLFRYIKFYCFNSIFPVNILDL